MVLDDPSPDEVLRYASAYTYRVRVAVPEEQAAQARELLAGLETEGREALARHVRQFHRMLFQAILFALGLMALGWFLSGATVEDSWSNMGWVDWLRLLFPFTFAGMLFLAFFSVRRKHKRRASAPPSPSGDDGHSSARP